jgi:hypothetical protein
MYHRHKLVYLIIYIVFYCKISPALFSVNQEGTLSLSALNIYRISFQKELLEMKTVGCLHGGLLLSIVRARCENITPLTYVVCYYVDYKVLSFSVSRQMQG